jgi:hypothetical protein
MNAVLGRLPRRRTDVLLRDEGTESLVIARGQPVPHVLNPTARAIWELCDGATTVDEVVDAICQVFAVPPDRAVDDVIKTLDDLAQAGLVDWTGNG